MTNFSPLRSQPGVITAPGAEPRFAAALLVDDSGKTIRVVNENGSEDIKVARIDPDGNSARLVLVTKSAKYNWRPIREADGIWISKYRIPIPTEAIPGVAATGDPVSKAILSAYSDGDSPYVLGVTYETADVSWARNGGQFLAQSGDDNTYATMDRIIIDPAKAK